MPSSSDKQARTMAAAAHSPAFARKVGVPQGVAQDFNASDRGTPRLSQAMLKQKARADALRKRAKTPPPPMQTENDGMESA